MTDPFEQRELIIRCRNNCDGAAVVLRLPVPPEDGEIFRGSIAVQAPAMTFESAFSPSVEHLRTFARDLQILRERLQGAAKLEEYEGSCITFEVSDPRLGRIGISGRMIPTTNSGVVTTFAGLVIDQSYVPDILSDVDRLLRDARAW